MALNTTDREIISANERSLSMEPNSRVFVGGIPVRVEKKTIVDFFSQFGAIKYCKIKKNSKTGRSLGYAYITFEDPQVMLALVNRQIEFCGRICECKPVFKKNKLKEELAKEKRKKLLVYNIDPTITNVELQEYFEKLAEINYAFVVKDPENKFNKGYGYVVFNSEEELDAFFDKNPALLLNGKPFMSSNKLTVPPKKKKEGSAKAVSNMGEQIKKATNSRTRQGSQKAKRQTQEDSQDSDLMSVADSEEEKSQFSSPDGRNSKSGSTERNHLQIGRSLHGMDGRQPLEPDTGSDHAKVLREQFQVLHVSNSEDILKNRTDATKSTRVSKHPHRKNHFSSFEAISRRNEIRKISKTINQDFSNYRFNKPEHSQIMDH